MLRGTEDDGLAGFVDALEILGALGGGNGMGMYPQCDTRFTRDRANINAAVCAALRLFGARLLEEQINENVDRYPRCTGYVGTFMQIYRYLRFTENGVPG